MFCPKCGNETPDSAVYCPTCGVNMREVLKKDERHQLLESVKKNDESVEKTNKALHINDRWRSFVDTRYHYYEAKWSQSTQPEIRAGWNWASFFVGLFWLGYRKLYKEVLIVIGLFFLFDLLVAVTGLPGINTLLTFAVYIYLGFKGNALYYRHVKQKLSELEREDLTPQDYRRFGGVSGLGILIVVLLFFSYIGISSLLFGVV
ncbi:hypothetical protein GCM10012290_19920 [Halolactibacillus alkaliphilus]|uniref:Zinc-ribbon domain-containing protein n=1 Tax=Halolactibacillus alkaliphilus TaxID=442899 RepID=A0A511X591_9BACI|nr:DUF2628 domain-containing protein [Halolactibacillus alkaliphilus]GEN58085.1 hypothetical protein HAL01_25490 [Halolactibacillus alkaliphilus]GGN73267.1 hypothetical protein GCM10012290_19920 [Halolactibacillus alkaliphilus]SFO96491.1 zinc-ribbon domain-containing protein [Halolactibacillus alkaliphilus]